MCYCFCVVHFMEVSMSGDRTRLIAAIELQMQSLRRRSKAQPLFAEVADAEVLAYTVLLDRVRKEFDDAKEKGSSR